MCLTSLAIFDLVNFDEYFQVIESDPEDDLIEKASRPKYSRGPEMSSTPTYSMDTDISTLEAPTFSTLNQGPSQIMMMLRWDHPSNLIGKKVNCAYPAIKILSKAIFLAVGKLHNHI